jgi:hypothetical protein
MAFGLPKFNSKAFGDAVITGMGLTAGFIVLSGGLKLIEKQFASVIPKEISSDFHPPSAYPAAGSYYGTGNSLDMLYE